MLRLPPCPLCPLWWSFSFRGLDLPSRIQPIAQTITQEVEPQNEHHDGDAGKDRQMGRIENVRTSAVQHGAPAWRRRLHAEPQKTERRFADDRTSHAERDL